MPDGAPGDAERLTRVQRRFSEFAAEHAALPLYSSLCRHLAGDGDLASLLLVARPGQARPVLWLAALHDLVLRRPDVPAAQWYPSVVGPDHTPTGDPWDDVRRTVAEHRDELLQQIATHGTQTNEVNRAVYVALGLVAASLDSHPRPLALVELGASAGLLLAVDRYDVRLDSSAGPSVVLGDRGSPVHCGGHDRSGVTAVPRTSPLELPTVGGRVGVDLEPVDLSDDEAVRWLEACLWPEVPGRVERFRAARDQLRGHQPTVLRDDLVDGMRRAVDLSREQAGAESHVLLHSSWALTYVDASRRADLEAEVRALARDCEVLSWLSAEPPGCAPGIEPPAGVGGGTVLGLRRWREGQELGPVTLGTTHPHGAWVDLAFEGLEEQTS